MSGDAAVKTRPTRYGPLSFTVAVFHLCIVEFATWLLLPYSLVFVLPPVLVYMAIAALIALASGRIGQIGRGMLLGSLSAPLSMIVFGAAWAAAHAIGPI